MTLATAIRRCESCGRPDEPRAYGSGYPLASVFLLTDAPTPADVDAGVVFSETAEPLGKAFDALGIAPTDVYGASSMRCVPTGPDDVRVCSTHLLTEIEIVRPAVLIAFGPRAVAAVRGLDGWCGLQVGDEVVSGEGVRVRSDLMLLPTEPLPEGVTNPDAKRRLWRDLQALRGTGR